MASYYETRKELEEKYPRYFELLNIDMTTRHLNIYQNTDIKEYLDLALDNYIECKAISATIPVGQSHPTYLEIAYERDRKKANDIKAFYIAKEIFENKSDIDKSIMLYKKLKEIIPNEIELKELYNKYNEAL